MKAIIAVPATLALIYLAHSRKSLTPAGLVAATVTAVAHAVHPWNLPFVLLVVFFLAGTRVTHIKEDVKANLTKSSKGSSGEGPRTHVQVFANSLVASVFSLLHAYQLSQRKQSLISSTPPTGSLCFAWPGDLLVIGIIANYASVAADTFSSELGILSPSPPRLLTSLTLRRVPPGTNGGVTVVGLLAGLMGSMLMVTTSMLFLPLCADTTQGALGGGTAWTADQKRSLMFFLTLWGAAGSVLDSLLGGLLQRSVRDVRTGKIVQGEGGARVLVSAAVPGASETNTMAGDIQAALLSGEGRESVPQTDPAAVAGEDLPSESSEKRAGGRSDRYDHRERNRRSSFGDDKPSRVTESGWDLLDNNDVNFLMAVSMSVGAMVVAGWHWGVPLDSIMQA